MSLQRKRPCLCTLCQPVNGHGPPLAWVCKLGWSSSFWGQFPRRDTVNHWDLTFWQLGFSRSNWAPFPSLCFVKKFHTTRKELLQPSGWFLLLRELARGRSVGKKQLPLLHMALHQNPRVLCCDPSIVTFHKLHRVFPITYISKLHMVYQVIWPTWQCCLHFRLVLLQRLFLTHTAGRLSCLSVSWNNIPHCGVGCFQNLSWRQLSNELPSSEWKLQDAGICLFLRLTPDHWLTNVAGPEIFM